MRHSQSFVRFSFDFGIKYISLNLSGYSCLQLLRIKLLFVHQVKSSIVSVMLIECSVTLFLFYNLSSYGMLQIISLNL